MTARDLERRVEHWRKLLAPEWRITLHPKRWSDDDHEDDDSHYNASVRASNDYLHADLWVRRDYYCEQSLGEVDVTIIHELVHLLFREVRRTLDLVARDLQRDVYAILEAHFLTEEERLVERLSRVIATLEHPDGLLYGTTRDDD